QCHLADCGGGPVNQMSALRAIAFSQYLESHGRRLYGAAIMAEVIAAKEILKHIRKGDLKNGFTAREAHRPRWTGLTDHEQVKDGLGLLVDHNHLRVESVKTGGRSTATYAINPAVLR